MRAPLLRSRLKNSLSSLTQGEGVFFLRPLLRQFTIVAALCLVPMWGAAAADYPVKPIRIIAPYPARSGTDILARIVAQKMSEHWGAQVLVDSRAGAGGSVGTALGGRATPDGYTMTMGVSSAFGINPTLYTHLAYDPRKDFAPIANLGLTPQVLVASPAAEFKTVKE